MPILKTYIYIYIYIYIYWPVCFLTEAILDESVAENANRSSLSRGIIFITKDQQGRYLEGKREHVCERWL